jgi:hypothetical protein
VKHTGKSDNLSNNLSNKSPYPEAMAHHPTGITFDIVGIEAGNRGRSCEEHDVCGSILEENTVVRIRHVQILVMAKRNRLWWHTGSQTALIVVMWAFFSVTF